MPDRPGGQIKADVGSKACLRISFETPFLSVGTVPELCECFPPSFARRLLTSRSISAPGELGRNQSAGALGLGTQTASALTVLFTFLACTCRIRGWCSE